MPVFKLEPIEGTEEHGDWWTSSLSPTPVWLRADNADQARQRMHLATCSTVCVPLAAAGTPWANAELVRCTEDTSLDPPSGIALLANGKISIKLP